MSARKGGLLRWRRTELDSSWTLQQQVLAMYCHSSLSCESWLIWKASHLGQRVRAPSVAMQLLTAHSTDRHLSH